MMAMGRAVLLAAAVQLACLDAPPASTVKDAAAPACETFDEWKDPVPVPGLSAVQGVSPTVDAEADLLVWETTGPNNQLAAAVRDGEAFAVADETLVGELNTMEPERNPTLSADGLTIWFTRGTKDAPILFVSHRLLDSDPFPAPDEVSLEVAPEGPDVWDGANEMFFSVQSADFDLARATCENVRSCTYQGLLPGLAEAMDDVYPTIRSDGLELIYYSESMVGMVRATRASARGDFQRGPALPFPGFDPDLTADGMTLYFAIDGMLYRTTRSCTE